MFQLLRKRSSSSNANIIHEQLKSIQEGNQDLRNEFIGKYKPFIGKIVSQVCKRYVNEEIDDEFSIGLIAFNEAIDNYSSDKGSSFLSFANLVIRRRVIDYIRYEVRRKVTQSIDQDYEDYENAENHAEVYASMRTFIQSEEEIHRREEIIHFQEQLKLYGIQFHDLVDESPKHQDARENMLMVAKTILENKQLKDQLLEKKRLPIRNLTEKVSVSRKTIERNRKYIIALTIVLIEDYLYLKEYLKRWIQ